MSKVTIFAIPINSKKSVYAYKVRINETPSEDDLIKCVDKNFTSDIRVAFSIARLEAGKIGESDISIKILDKLAEFKEKVTEQKQEVKAE